jgi:hypothetical protein
VRGPASLTASADHVGVLVQGGCGGGDEEVDFFRLCVKDAEAVAELAGQEVALFRLGRSGEEVGRVFGCEVFRGVGGVGEGAWVPEVLWI